jgi:predicted PurR-regulated permease PerM
LPSDPHPSLLVFVIRHEMRRPDLLGIGVFFVGQCVADYILAPYLIGPRVKLNPVWLTFAMFAFGSIFGRVGLLIAGPMAAATGVLVRFGLGRYYASTVHTGGGVAPPAGADPPAM